MKARALRWFSLVVVGGLLPALTTAIVGCDRKSDSAKVQSLLRGIDWSRDVYVYNVQVASAARLPSGNAAFDLTLAGELELKVVERGGREVRLLATITGADVKLGGKDDPEASKIAQELERPALFVLERGRVSDSWFEPGLSAVVTSMWRTIVGALQLSEGEGSPTWSAEEYDSSGRYRAEYRKQEDGQIVRRKAEYIALLEGAAPSSAQATALAPRISESETRFQLADGQLEGVRQKEVAKTRFDEKTSLDVVTSVALRLRPGPASPGAQPFDQRAFLDRAWHLPPQRLAALPRDAMRREFDQEKMAGTTFSQVLAEVERQAIEQRARVGNSEDDAEDDDSSDVLKERTDTFSRLVAFLRWNSEAIDAALAKIREQSAAASALVSGLAAANTEKTQAGLIGLIGDAAVESKLRMRAMIGLARSRQPSREGVQALRAQLADPVLGGQALLGLGSMSRRLAEAGRADQVEAIQTDLRTALDGASDTASRVRALRAISNSGDAALLPLVKNFIEDADHQLRGAAMEATRHMKTAEVDELVAKRLLAEENAEVQHSILRSMKTRGASKLLAEALTARISTAESANVRRRAVELARVWSSEYPVLRAAVSKAAENDPDESVRAAARAMK